MLRSTAAMESCDATQVNTTHLDSLRIHFEIILLLLLNIQKRFAVAKFFMTRTFTYMIPYVLVTHRIRS